MASSRTKENGPVKTEGAKELTFPLRAEWLKGLEPLCDAREIAALVHKTIRAVKSAGHPDKTSGAKGAEEATRISQDLSSFASLNGEQLIVHYLMRQAKIDPLAQCAAAQLAGTEAIANNYRKITYKLFDALGSELPSSPVQDKKWRIFLPFGGLQRLSLAIAPICSAHRRPSDFMLDDCSPQFPDLEQHAIKETCPAIRRLLSPHMVAISIEADDTITTLHREKSPKSQLRRVRTNRKLLGVVDDVDIIHLIEKEIARSPGIDPLKIPASALEKADIRSSIYLEPYSKHNPNQKVADPEGSESFVLTSWIVSVAATPNGPAYFIEGAICDAWLDNHWVARSYPPAKLEAGSVNSTLITESRAWSRPEK